MYKCQRIEGVSGCSPVSMDMYHYVYIYIWIQYIDRSYDCTFEKYKICGDRY